MSNTNEPAVFILIPNYNNGMSSSDSGEHDFIRRLLQSLSDTLSNETTPFEILVCDDGSTDDSLETLRAWATRSWPDGRPFLELVEQEHCGVLARIANLLSRRARGRILARLDGDVECLTSNWGSRLAEVFATGTDSLGVVGSKQLTPDMRIHAFGDWVLHPKGYIHAARGLPRHSAQHATEVDHVMGSFYCCRKAVWEQLGGYDETFLRGQTIDFGLRARMAGFRCFAVPHIEYVHAHSLRDRRPTEADTREGVSRSLACFEAKWGFSRIAPDLDEVRRRYAGTGLLWNPRWFGAPAAPATDPIVEWSSCDQDQMTKARVDVRVLVTNQIIDQTGWPQFTAIVGCGEGLMVGCLARRELACTGIDRRAEAIATAQRGAAGQTYPGQSPRFIHQADHGKLPLESDQVDLLLIYDEIEQHPNPVALNREARRVLIAGKPLVVISKRKPPREDVPTDLEHRYRGEELISQFVAVGGFQMAIDPQSDQSDQPMIIVMRCAGRAQNASPQAA